MKEGKKEGMKEGRKEKMYSHWVSKDLKDTRKLFKTKLMHKLIRK